MQRHVTDGLNSKWLCRARVGNLGLGNRNPNKKGDKWEWCPLCQRVRRQKMVNEVHVLLECNSMRRERAITGIDKYKQQAQRMGIRNQAEVLKKFLGGDGTQGARLNQRGGVIGYMTNIWINKAAAI